MQGNRSQQELQKLLESAGLVPTVTLRSNAAVRSLALILEAAGLQMIEVMNRHEYTWDAINRLKDMMPDLKIAVGTVLSFDDLTKAKQAGASFVSSPGFLGELWDACEGAKIPYLCGFSTPSELLQISARGGRVAKFFPAANLGPGFLRNMGAAFPHMHFVPSGGLDAKLAAQFASLKQVLCLAGSWSLPAELENLPSNYMEIAGQMRETRRNFLAHTLTA